MKGLNDWIKNLRERFEDKVKVRTQTLHQVGSKQNGSNLVIKNPLFSISMSTKSSGLNMKIPKTSFGGTSIGSKSFGSNNEITGLNNHVPGRNNDVNGNNNNVPGTNNDVIGSDNKVYGSNNDVFGSHNKVYGRNNIIKGSGHTIYGSNQTIMGSGVMKSQATYSKSKTSREGRPVNKIPAPYGAGMHQGNNRATAPPKYHQTKPTNGSSSFGSRWSSGSEGRPVNRIHASYGWAPPAPALHHGNNKATGPPKYYKSKPSNGSSSIASRGSGASASESKRECPICYEGLANRHPLALLCGHIVCKPCLQSLIRNNMLKCPICTKVFRPSDARPIFL